ncbi:hypothetical protein BYZ73_12350 [Rhodovulum viride]|uniref:NADPH-dependent ferric siderophore reductase n=1 Tax=Rhodovulum viride TaxID=1231134 RepID=A0ABX9DHI1_9RHOB|nr:hypothetical protein BYZ73_12350 [Rhodovulum viride]
MADGAEAALEALRALARDWERPLTESAQGLVLELFRARVSARREGADLGLEIVAPDAACLRGVQDSLTELLAGHSIAIRWEDVATGALAPGLSIGQAVWCRRISPGFLRLRVRLADAARFGTGGLHVRLLVPPGGRAPVWPRIGASARVDWPSGADALHRPVYTVSDLGPDRVDIDIFDHPGSPTCDWARGVVPGAPVGVMGPGGGWLPEGDPLLLFGDETALPAILRILRITGVPARAWVTAAPEDLAALGADRRVTRTDDLLEALDAADPGPGGFVWFAARDEVSREARRRLTARGLPRGRFSAVAYWR